MSVNKHRPHVFVIPEDRANEEMANGFILEVQEFKLRSIQVLPVAGGWRKVLECFQSEHVPGMEANSHRSVVLLIDFDARQDRLAEAKRAIPERLAERVFILGVWTEPEHLRTELGSYESIGKALATDCREETDTTWGHRLLQHNTGELQRLRERIRPILF